MKECEVRKSWLAAPFWRTSVPRRCSAPPQQATLRKRLRMSSRLRVPGAVVGKMAFFPWRRGVDDRVNPARNHFELQDMICGLYN